MRGKYHQQYALAKHTSWHVGGLAQACYFPADLDDLVTCFREGWLPKPYTFLGLGSNVLVRDGGVKGTVIVTLGGLQALECVSPGVVSVQSGVTCAKFARFCASYGMHEAAFFSGIPGTMGGALAMNAGAFGGETWSNVIAVDRLSEAGELYERLPKNFDVAYRQVRCLKNEKAWFVGATFSFSQGDVAEEKQLIRKTIQQRNASQPIGLLSCGSVFRNPPGDYAARLIESCGLKGYRRGKAMISDKHANFIINEGSCSSEDIEELILDIQNKVYEERGVHLMPEVRVLGEKK